MARPRATGKGGAKKPPPPKPNVVTHVECSPIVPASTKYAAKPAPTINDTKTVLFPPAKKPEGNDIFSSDNEDEELFSTQKRLPKVNEGKTDTDSSETGEECSIPTEVQQSIDADRARDLQNRTIVNSIVANHLFPRLKFLDKHRDLEFSTKRSDVCGLVLHHCNVPEKEQKEFWSKNKKHVVLKISRLRSDRSKDLKAAFHGKVHFSCVC